MRFLAAEFPAEWPVSRLADSFPVSREGAVRVLRSSFRVRSPSELLRHDRRVWLAWKQLGGEGAQPTLANAAGNLSLPQPDRGRQLSAGKPAFAPRKFESLVAGYCEEKRGEAGEGRGDDVVRKHEEESRRLLASITERGAGGSGGGREGQASLPAPRGHTTPRSLLDVRSDRQPRGAAAAAVEDAPRTARPTREERTTRPAVTDSDAYAADVLSQVRRGEYRQTGRVAAYIYDDKKGYQHLSGVQVAPPASSAALRRDRDGVYSDGKNRYDDDGEFLYRLP